MSLKGSVRSSGASTVSSAGTSSPFKDSLQDELGLWSESIPLEDDLSFQSLVNSPQHATSHIFEPKDQHCGIWKDAPNNSCHASFGDQGTTASVSCFGNLIQINQFLGAGRSGIFSMDHKNTDTPYYVSVRASDLDALGSGNGDLSFGLYLPKAFLPNRAPEIKWVNWRWPRYEWNVLENNVRPVARVTVQFFVKNNTVYQQFVVTNTGISPIEKFSIRAGCHMLIRDLDYLEEPSYNEDDSKTYIRGRGPNAFSWITANVIDKDKSDSAKGVDTEAIHVESNSGHGGEGLQQPEIRTETAGNEESTSPPTILLDESIGRHTASGQTNVEHDLLPASDQVTGVREQASISDQQLSTEGNKTDDLLQEQIPNKSKRPPGDTELWQQRKISDTWTTKDAHAVVSIMSLFVNGTAQKMGMGRHKSHWTIGASGGNSSVLKITAAYKMIAVPDRKGPWKNFLIPAGTADVDAMISAESKELWNGLGDCSNSCSLRDIGICTKSVEEYEMGQDTGGRGQKSEHSGSENRNAPNTATNDEATTNTGSNIDAGTGRTLAAAESSNKHRSSQDASAKPQSGITLGTSQKIPLIDNIEYLAWRHTEHILSVCTLPLSVPLPSEEETSAASIPQGSTGINKRVNTSSASQSAEDENDVPIALTCGDMSGHRICTSASFFAFEFLVNMLRRLQCVEQAPYILSLQRRIAAVCRGHIRWLEWIRKPWLPLHQTESLLGSGCFAANYWVNGQMNRKQSATWQPNDAMTDTPFQILKVTVYVKWLRTASNTQSSREEGVRSHMALLRDLWAYLLTELDDLDKRKACAWRHESEDGLNTYRLDDHFWLWSALAEMHSLGLWSLTETNIKSWEDSPDRWMSKLFPSSPEAKHDKGTLMHDPETVRDPKSLANFVSKTRRLLPKEIQRAVLQRFTVENDVSGERMLAVTRSARDTRFFFHTRDTALFYGHKRGFFRPETSFKELWERTVKCQIRHEEALQEGWHSPLRFALGAVAGLSGFSIDKRSPAELVRQSVEALIQTSSHNAFIPGEMDAVTREPAIFQVEADRDYYYHVSFEACNILLEYGRGIDEAFRSEQISPHSPVAKQTEDDNQQLQRQREMMEILLNEILAQPKRQSLTNLPQGIDYRALGKLAGADARLDRKRIPMVMKKSMPFNSMIDASSITLLEEEWLYNYPDFLLVKDLDLQRQLEMWFDKESKQYRAVYGSQISIIDKALDSLGKTEPKEFSFSSKKTDTDEWARDGMMVSLPKQKSRREARQKWSIGTVLTFFHEPINKSLWELISKERSAVTAKKRFLWLPARSNPETALLCWLASTDGEKPAISLFFDRHAGYDNHLWDDTTMVMNTWQTELHLCFWLIYDKNSPLHEGLPHPIVAPWPRGNDKEFRRASIGFRFNGDFFDRYWTCHFIQYVPGFDGPELFGFVPRHWLQKLDGEKVSWQRKVLELQLLQHILTLILTSSDKILKEIEAELGIKEGILIISVLTTEAYSVSANHWQIYEELLEKAEEDIISSLNTLSKWASREDDRGQERPRWTRNDETKYRGSINKLHNQTERQRWDLERSREKMRKLRETLATRQAKIRSDLEAKREQNIRYFTYVTVVFLPLGFASSFYSMNGAPSYDLIISLSKFAAAAFAVTAVLLFIAGPSIAVGGKGLTVVRHGVLAAKKYSNSMLNRAVLQPLQKYSRGTKEKSLLVKSTSTDDEKEEAKVSNQGNLKKDWMTSSWFWPAYLFLELPTRTISSALNTVRTGNLSPRAVWRVFLGILVLPIYGMSRAVLFSLGNIVLLLKILRHLYRLSRKESSKDDKKGVSESKPSDEPVQGPQMGDTEKNPSDRSEFPDHFQKLMPTTKPLNSLQTLEGRLKKRLENVEPKENGTAHKESSGT